MLVVLSVVYKVDVKMLLVYVGVDFGVDGYVIYCVNVVILGLVVDL